MDEQGQDNARRISPLGRATAILVMFFLLTGAAPFLFLTFGYPFLPSSQFYEACRPFGLISALAIGVLCFWGFFSGAIESHKAKGADKRFAGNFVLSSGASFLMMSVTHTAFIFLVPMIAAGVSGGPVTIRYLVKDADAHRVRGCPRPVQLEDMPWLLGSVCGVPDDLRHRLEAGMRVELIGWGSRYGLFYDRIRIATETER